jgi:hypothetical protein
MSHWTLLFLAVLSVAGSVMTIRHAQNGRAEALPYCRFERRSKFSPFAKKSTGGAFIRDYRAAAATSFSIGAPIRLPHSVHEPS